MKSSSVKLIFALVAASLAAGCAVGPDYKRPEIVSPAAFKETAGWQLAVPKDELARGKWWKVFGDTELDTLIEPAGNCTHAVCACGILPYGVGQCFLHAQPRRFGA
jgi:hypothetical protein